MSKVGVVGLGNAARTLHLPALAGLSEVECVGGCDPDPDARESAADAFGIRAFESLGALIRDGSPETVIVCTHPDTHVELCVQALEAGVHVLCEKPFAPSVAGAERILAAAERAGRRVALNHEFREVPIYRALYERVGDAATGPLRFAQAWQTMDLPPWEEAGWRSDMMMGVLFEAGIHMLDYLVFLFGEPPAAVTAVMSSSGAHETESDAVALVTLEFPGGRLAQLTQNRLCTGDLQYFEVRADCERASLRASFGGRARVSMGLFRSTRPHFRWEWGASGIAWQERADGRSVFASNPKDPAMVGTRAVIAKTVAAFASGASPPVPGEAGKTSLEVLAACYVSAREGRRIELAAARDQLREWRLS